MLHRGRGLVAERLLLFVGVYPGLSEAMLTHMENVFSDFFQAVRTTGRAAV